MFNIQVVSRALSQSLNIDTFNIDLKRKLNFSLLSLKARASTQSISSIITFNDRVKVLTVMIIAMNNSVKDDYDHYTSAREYLDMLTQRLNARMSMNTREAMIIDHCFNV